MTSRTRARHHGRQTGTRLALVAALAASIALGTAGCAAPGPDLNDGHLDIVTATNVWADIAEQVGGDLVVATPLITDPSQDPHSFEASARDQLAVAKADLVITNGGGYDDFLTQLASAQNRQNFDLTKALATAKATPANGAEHYWYSLSAVKALAATMAAEFARQDSANGDEYAKNLEAFNTRLAPLESQLAALHTSLTTGPFGDSRQFKAFSTEPLGDQLLVDSGFDLLTNQQFSQAIENETDIPVGVLNDVKNLFVNGEAHLLVVNEQTRSTQIDQLIAVARRSHESVVQLSEQIPAGVDWLTWMKRNLSTIATAMVRY